MDSNTKDVLIAGLALVGTLLGVYVGFWLQEVSTEKRELRSACRTVIALSLEAAAQLLAIEAELGGGPPAPEVRPELGPAFFEATAVLRRAPRAVRRAMDQLSTTVQAAMKLAVTEPERETQRQDVLMAVGLFEAVANWELRAHWWNRAWTAMGNRARAIRQSK